MTDLPAEAVEAAARAYYKTHDCSPETPWDHLPADDRAWWADRVRPILTAAAPIIAAQATADLRARIAALRDEADHEIADLVAEGIRQKRRAIEAENASESLRNDLRALRDEWRVVAASDRAAAGQESERYDLGWLTGHGVSHGAHADALDALLRERAR